MMAETQKWEYYVGSYDYKVTKKGGAFSKAQSAWILTLDKEYSLREGLKIMGTEGWELVSTHSGNLMSGGQIGSWYSPDYIYIFKRPLIS